MWGAKRCRVWGAERGVKVKGKGAKRGKTVKSETAERGEVNIEEKREERIRADGEGDMKLQNEYAG